MGTLSASDSLLRLVMAELVRRRLADEDGNWPRVVKVTGYGEREVVRYPGTSSTWTENYVDIFWAGDYAGEFEVYEWRGTVAELNEALERLVEAY